MAKTKVAIIGTGNIGSDLMMKILRSPYLECALFTGQNAESRGIAMAKERGIRTSVESAEALRKHREEFEVIIDATSAEAHEKHRPIFEELGKFSIDLTPSKSRRMCVPAVNLHEALDNNHGEEINLISCGAQASVPLVHVLAKAGTRMKYVECVTSVAARSAGLATRENIDEYVYKTREALKSFGKAREAKVILNLNPAEPPINMHNTLYIEIEGNVNMDEITVGIDAMVAKIQEYVPGYRLKLKPMMSDGRLTIMTEVIGAGDFLPKYAGNLDIITCAAVAVAEEYHKKGVSKAVP